MDKSKIPKFGIHILSGLKIKKKNAIISAKGNLVICSARCCAKYLKNGFKGWIKYGDTFFPHKRILFKTKYNPNYRKLSYKKSTQEIPRKQYITNVY